ncbi:BAK_1a_G0010970.mRNA.1.CDS.1 [Saccharomyces cerevisiae]|nr:BAK_1a_G0010970.mRNA.1.CDS.1 [Saccharomyces cerevisiae]CAI7076124.1 BAK_1a_G0010970.mRNA.1.CDS.1 [Saccharomyces cerevisiae]
MQNPPLIRPDMYNQGSSSMATYNASEKNLNEHPSPQIAQPSTSQKLPYRINPTTTNGDTDISVNSNPIQPPLPNLMHLSGPSDYRSIHQSPIHPSYIIPPHSNERKQSASYNRPQNAHVSIQPSVVFPPKSYSISYAPYQINPPLPNGLPNQSISLNKEYIAEEQLSTLPSRNTSVTTAPPSFQNSADTAKNSADNNDNNDNVTKPVPDKDTQLISSSGKTLRNTRRAAQNRTAQKAFRQRKEKYIKNLEQKSKIFDDLLAENNYFKSLNDSLRNDNNILIAQHEAIRNAITMLRSEYDVLCNENNMLKNENSIIKNEHNMSRNENENLKLENKRFHAEYIRMIEDIENTRRKEQEQRDEIEQLIKKIRSLEEIVGRHSDSAT